MRRTCLIGDQHDLLETDIPHWRPRRVRHVSSDTELGVFSFNVKTVFILAQGSHHFNCFLECIGNYCHMSHQIQSHDWWSPLVSDEAILTLQIAIGLRLFILVSDTSRVRYFGLKWFMSVSDMSPFWCFPFTSGGMTKEAQETITKREEGR